MALSRRLVQAERVDIGDHDMTRAGVWTTGIVMIPMGPAPVRKEELDQIRRQ